MPMQTNKVLLKNESATGPVVDWIGGTGVFAVTGTFGGATVSLEFLGPDGATWLAVGTDTTKTANGAGLFTLYPASIRAAVSGGTPSALHARVDSADYER